jgi:hypothetical protein
MAASSCAAVNEKMISVAEAGRHIVNIAATATTTPNVLAHFITNVFLASF